MPVDLTVPFLGLSTGPPSPLPPPHPTARRGWAAGVDQRIESPPDFPLLFPVSSVDLIDLSIHAGGPREGKKSSGGREEGVIRGEDRGS